MEVNTLKSRQQLLMAFFFFLAVSLCWRHCYKTAIVCWGWQSRGLIVSLQFIVYEAKLYFWPAHNRIFVRVNEVQLWVTKLTRWGGFYFPAGSRCLSSHNNRVWWKTNKSKLLRNCWRLLLQQHGSILTGWFSLPSQKIKKVPILFAWISAFIPASHSCSHIHEAWSRSSCIWFQSAT